MAHPTISSSLSPHSHHSISHCSHLPEVVLPPNPHSDVLPTPTHPSQSSVVPLTSPLFSVPVPPILSSTNCVPSICSHASVYVPPFESHPTLVVPSSQSHPTLVVPPSQSRTPLVVPPSQSHPTLVVPPSQSHPTLVVPSSQSHTPLVVPLSQSHTPLIVPPSQSHTPLIVPPSQTSNTAPSTDSHKLSHKIVQPSLHPPHVPCSSHAPPVSPAPIPPPPSRATPEQATLPTPKLPSSPREWAEADQHFKDTLVPSVLDCSNVDVMDHILCHGIHSFLASRHGVRTPRQHHASTRKDQTIKRKLQEVKIEKNALKKRMRGLQRDGSSPDEVRVLAHEFHQIVRKLSKLSKDYRKMQQKSSATQQRKECRKDIHRFARKVLDDDNYSSIQPTFTKDVAEHYFSATYSTSAQRSFTRPSWMPQPQPPTVPFVIDPFSLEEVEAVIAKTRSNSSPSPLDQVPYTVLKKCPSLMPALLHLYNTCWLTQTAPQAWKVGTIHLLGKSKAAQDPSQPSNFRPIALTSCIGKVFSSLLKQRWLSYMLDNHYLNTSVQKAFVDGIPGCTEHHVKLLSIINEARRKHKSLCVAWLDLANAFGSVHHDLIRFSLNHYHAPPVMVDMVSNLYAGLLAIFSTRTWTTAPIPLLKGVYQGDPLSVAIFNTVMNTLVDTITKNYPDLGYSLASSHGRTNLLQYADDTSLITDGPSSCRTLLSATDAWLDWSGMKANVPKCVSLAVQASSGGAYDPKLTLSSEPIPYISTSTFRFLGTPISIHSSSDQARGALLQKLQSMLEKVDNTLLSRQQRLLLYRVGVCPRLSWDLSTSELSITWLKSTLQPLATRYLKKWSGLARTADPNKLFLPKANGGLDLPELTTLYKKLHAAKAARFMCSRDPTVRDIATQETLQEPQQKRPTFQPYTQVVEVMKEDPGANRRTITRKVKASTGSL